jgi:hypothetical protein
MAIIAIACLGNFVVFDIVASFLGRDAMNGYVQSGHFYLREHSRFTEVSRLVFPYSLWHARSIFVTHLLGSLALDTLIATRKQCGWQRAGGARAALYLALELVSFHRWR